MSSVTPEIPPEEATTRDPQDTEGILRDKIKQNPLDILQALQLIEYYEKDYQFEKSREVYNELHERFPLYSPLWTLHLRSELQRDEFETVERILAQCLAGDSENNDLDLWSTYLDYVRRKNNLITGGQEARAVVIKAFKLVMEKCAVFDPKSITFWNDYLGFLQQWKPMNKWEEQQRLDMIRDLYKRMLCVPFDRLEKMWNQYTVWEQEVNSLTARKFIGELSADYMKARSLYQELSYITKNIRRSSPQNLKSANKSNIPNYHATQSDRSQLNAWLKWIEWEKDNKLMLSDDRLKQRVTYVYQQAIQHLLFEPEIWYDYVMYEFDNDAARQHILKIALRANPFSPTLTFKLAECYEIENKAEEVQSCFEESISNILTQHKQELAREGVDDNVDIIEHQKKTMTYIYCVYMNTMKRLSGLSAARAVFGKCRKLKRTMTHDIYIENAYLEFQNQNDHKTASKVLELGLKYFNSDGVYVNKYMDFLILLNRGSQIKTLFETSVEKVIDQEQLKQIYMKMIGYESKYGDLNNVYQLEKRFFEKFPDEDLIEVFSARYKIQNENKIKDLELTYKIPDYVIGNQKITESSSSKRTFNEDIDDTTANKKQKVTPALPQEICDLLSVLPKKQYFKAAFLDPSNLVHYLNDQVEIPEITSD
ncbi:mRNA 3'-end-processing protein RNA14 [Nakaseomyces bracarensis]|uniref:mRNA 3'-end-processing protein RNA14 n=1 Tax=Nakaseomyces bracarensis TaxID=273131 RepID=A0ABR4NVL1_9SACH